MAVEYSWGLAMVWLFTEIADGFDKLVHDDEVFLEGWGTRVAGDYVRDGGVVNWLELAGVSLTNAGFTLSTTVAKGFVDVLRLGDGVKKGGWGYGQDALRGLMVVGPVFRGLRSVAGLVAEVDFDAYLSNCAWVAGARQLRFGGRLLARVGDLARWAGLTAEETGGVRRVADLAPMFRLLGAGVRTIAPEGKAGMTTMDEVFQAARANRDGTLMFGVKWGKDLGHALIARWTLLGVRIIDRTGRVRSLSELEKLVPEYKGISSAVPDGEAALFVENSIAVKALANVPSLLNTLAVEVKPVVYRESKLAGVARVMNRASAQVHAPKPEVHLGTFNTTVVCHAPNSDQLQECRTYYSYTVGQGEALSSISRRVYGDQGKWSTIYAANRALIGSNPNLIRPGMQLALPSHKGPSRL
jgi:hypothetical protein